MRLTEDVAKRHDELFVASSRRGKRAGAIALICGVFVACAGESAPRVAAPSPVMATTANTAAPLSPIELSRRALADASTTKDPHERCRLLLDATILDPASVEAHLTRAESRCALARELLPSARAAFAARGDQRSAEALAAVAERAVSRADAKTAADALARFDLPSKLAAARIYAVDEPLTAARLFDEVAAAREAKGASLDELDARLDAAIARTDGGEPSRVGALIAPAAAAAKTYGAGWVAPKVLEALAAARVAGEDTSALVARAQNLGMFAGAGDAFAIERAIALHKDVPHLHRRIGDPAVRALLVVNAKDCAIASAHARAHRRLPGEGLVLGRDVARALKKICPSGEVPGRGTVLTPRLSPELADVVEVGKVEPLRAAARIEELLKTSADPSVRYAQWLISPKRTPATNNETSLLTLRLPEVEPSLRGRAALDIATMLRATVEATIPRGLAQALARLVAAADSERAEWDDVAAALITECAVSAKDACGVDLGVATARLRKRRTSFLATKGLLLSNEDLTPGVRLDVIVALVEEKKVLAAMKLNVGSGATATLASAAIAAGNGNCALAKSAAAKLDALRSTHEDVFAGIARRCP